MIKQLRMGLVLLVVSMAANATPETVVNELRSTTNTLMESLKKDQELCRENVDCLRKRVKQIAGRHFDTAGIAKMALGRHYKKLPRKERANFTIQFERLLLKVYGMVLLKNLDATISWSAKETVHRDKKRIIATARVLTPNSNEPIDIKFFMRTRTYYTGYKIFDVKVEGVSLVTNYRASFTRILRGRDGYQGLIDKIDEKNRSEVCPLNTR